MKKLLFLSIAVLTLSILPVQADQQWVFYPDSPCTGGSGGGGGGGNGGGGTVPDGGSTLILLGVGLGALYIFRKK